MRMIGQSHLTFRSDAMLVSGGATGLETIKQGLVAETKPAPTGLLEISMSHLAPLILKQAKRGDDKSDAAEMKKLVQETFKGDNDKIRATLEGGKALTGTFTMSADVVKFIGQMGAHAESTFDKVEPKIKSSKKKPKKDEDKKEEDK